MTGMSVKGSMMWGRLEEGLLEKRRRHRWVSLCSKKLSIIFQTNAEKPSHCKTNSVMIIMKFSSSLTGAYFVYKLRELGVES